MRSYLALLASLCLLPAAHAAKNLEMYFIDVEGGQATLIVAPSGESMLVDTGWAGFGARDAARIVAAAKSAHVKKIDYVLITHFHADHVGGAANLAERIPIGTFVDHGKNVETTKTASELDASYAKAIANSKHLVVKAGDKIPLKGVDVEVVTSNGDHIQTPLPGAGQPNAACSGVEKKANDASENARSLGFVLTYGSFKFVDLGDLTWNKELELVCPNNLIGTASVLLVSHHGVDQSNSPALVHGIHPRVAIINNGAKKGGSPATYQIVRSSPGLEDVWQVHFAVAGEKQNNAPDPFIANLDANCEGKDLHLSATSSGSFTITNQRNKYSKTYAEHGTAARL
jgi:beta-lactamase superfamily II metal-dependent hydrolase